MNESFIVEQDFLDKAKVAVVREGVKKIDWKKKELYFKKGVDKINYDKLLVAWGSHKKRLSKEFSNVHYLEDKISHERCSEAIGQAKTVVIMGGTLDAYQVASSAREHLDMIGKQDTQVVLISESKTEPETNYGKIVSKTIHEMMKQKRISVITNCDLKLKGDTKLDTIYFTRSEDKSPEKLYSKEGAIEYFISPDVVICENGVGPVKMDINKLIVNSEQGQVNRIAVDESGLPYCNMRFSLLHNDHASSIFGVGSATSYPSFFHKLKVRTDDIKYNIEAALYASLWMLDKEVEFKHIPFQSLKIGEKKFYIVGEREQPITDCIISGDPKSGKFVAFFVYGDEICGFLTCGYNNLHIYLMEAMKQLVMPSAAMMRANGGECVFCGDIMVKSIDKPFIADEDFDRVLAEWL